MGSDSDLSVMQDAAKVLTEFGIGSEVHTLSAHRTPDAVVEYVTKSEADGYKVFICGAGGAAHLAGVTAGLWRPRDLGRMRGVERTFRPRMSRLQAQEQYAGWQKAVQRALL